MAAYFFDDVIEVGNVGYYDESLDDFYFDTRTVGYFYPPAPDLRYGGDVAVIVGPACASACEFFSYDMTIEDRAAIVGFYPSAGLGGSVEDFDMPDGITVRYTIGRAVDVDGGIHIEGRGVVPTVRVPFTEEALFGEGDPELDAAIAALDSR
jgi:C-terminal processing protease CtpA/Prc